MKMTLLEMVQDILSAMDSDEVNSISDTTESLQVATLIKHAYNDIRSRANLPEQFELFELNASLDPDKPVVMYLPDDALSILWLKYDKRDANETEPNYQKVQYVPQDVFFEQFMGLQQQNQTDVFRFELIGPNSSTIDVACRNNKSPDYYTSFNDRTIIFDSFDQEVETTLMKNKTLAYGEFGSAFVMSDDYIPDLDARQFSLLYNEAKATAFADLKQTENARAERKVRQGWINLQNQKSAIPARPRFYDTTPDYSRRSYNRYGRRRGYHSSD